MVAFAPFKNYYINTVIMKKRNVKDNPCFMGDSKHSTAVCEVDIANVVLTRQQLQEYWETGDKDVVRSYVEKHYLGAAMQEWLMRTRDVELIMTYLKHHSDCGLFEGAEELLMAIGSYKLWETYLEQWRLRQSSVLLLFAEKQFSLLSKYVVKYPEENFSRTMLFLMFETGDKELIKQYVKTHPSLLRDERYASRLREVGFKAFVPTNL